VIQNTLIRNLKALILCFTSKREKVSITRDEKSANVEVFEDRVMYSQQNGRIIPVSIDALSFDSFDRDSNRDIVCVAPVRTIIRREEEVVLIRRVRKVEEFDAGMSCPVVANQ
jgi:hypothetical protein